MGETIASEAQQGGARNTASAQGTQVGAVVRQCWSPCICRETMFVQPRAKLFPQSSILQPDLACSLQAIAWPFLRYFCILLCPRHSTLQPSHCLVRRDVEKSVPTGEHIAGAETCALGERQPRRANPSNFPRLHHQEGRPASRGACAAYAHLSDILVWVSVGLLVLSLSC